MNMYLSNFELMQHHKYTLSDLENMIPYERDIYVGLLLNWIKESKAIRENRPSARIDPSDPIFFNDELYYKGS